MYCSKVLWARRGSAPDLYRSPYWAVKPIGMSHIPPIPQYPTHTIPSKYCSHIHPSTQIPLADAYSTDNILLLFHIYAKEGEATHTKLKPIRKKTSRVLFPFPFHNTEYWTANVTYSSSHFDSIHRPPAVNILHNQSAPTPPHCNRSWRPSSCDHSHQYIAMYIVRRSGYTAYCSCL